jgi:hypothetical protein
MPSHDAVQKQRLARPLPQNKIDDWLTDGCFCLLGIRQMNRMTEAATLFEQARRLRELALKLDQPIIKDDVLRLAERCEELATSTMSGSHCRSRSME